MKSICTTSTWIPLLDWVSTSQTGYMGVLSFAIDPGAPNKLYLLVGTDYFNNGSTAILRSTNYGNTFSITNVTTQFKANGNANGRNNGERLQVDPNDGNILYCGTQASGLFKSTNAGVSWANVTSFGTAVTPNANGINCIVFDSASGKPGSATKTFFVALSDTGTNFYRTDDGGTTFTPVAGATTTLMVQRAVMASDGNLYITYADTDGPADAKVGQIWKYNVASGAWTNVTPTGITYPFSGISVDPNNPKKLIASTINTYQLQYGTNTYGDRFYLTTDGGTTWRDLVGNGIKMNANGCPWFATASIHWAASIEFDPFNTNFAWVVSGDGCFYCSNLSNPTTTWYFGAHGIEETVPQDIVSVPNSPLFTATDDYGGFINTDPSQYGARFNPADGSNGSIEYAALDSNILARVGTNMYYTTNQGVSWTQAASVIGSGGRLAVSADGTTILHCPNGSSYTYRTTNYGTSWTACTGIGGLLPVADQVDPLRFYAYNNSNGDMYTSYDGGKTFAVSGYVGKGGNGLIRTAPGINGDVWIAMGSGGLKHSTNFGSTYTTIAGVTACSAVGLGKADSAASYFSIYIWGTVNGVTGVFGSTNEGTTWARINDNNHQYGGIGNGQFVIGDLNVFGRVYMSTVGRGVAYGQLVNPLPIKLIYFSGAIDNQQALLQWQTANETNNNYFGIERSTDGKIFSQVGTVASKGNGTGNLDYSYKDDISNATGTVYYRLKQVDKDGSYTYSNVISMSIKNTHLETMLVYPNPTQSNNINLKIQLTAPQQIEVRIVDMAGAVVYKSTALNLLQGSNSLNLGNVYGLSKGIYVVEVIGANNNTIGRNKVVVQ
jgi:hypothetical protein